MAPQEDQKGEVRSTVFTNEHQQQTLVAPSPLQPQPPKPKAFVHDLVEFRSVNPADPLEMAAVAKMEAESFPAEEGEETATLIRCAQQATPFYMVAVYEGEIVAHVFGNLTSSEHVTYQVTKGHSNEGSTLYIRSVLVKKNYRGGGFGRKVLDAYLSHVKKSSTNLLKSAMLLCKQHLLPFYQGVGFNLVGEAQVKLGVDQWYESRLDFSA